MEQEKRTKKFGNKFYICCLYSILTMRIFLCFVPPPPPVRAVRKSTSPRPLFVDRFTWTVAMFSWNLWLLICSARFWVAFALYWYWLFTGTKILSPIFGSFYLKFGKHVKLFGISRMPVFQFLISTQNSTCSTGPLCVTENVLFGANRWFMNCLWIVSKFVIQVYKKIVKQYESISKFQIR